MPAPLVKRISLDHLEPNFLAKFLELLAACRARNCDYYATLGYRTVAEQDALFAQGRTKPGPRVTDAPGGLSLHNYGLAVDVVRDADMARVGLQPYWDAKGYDVLHEEGKKLGLQVGILNAKGQRYDFGHVQVPVKAMTGRREKDVLLELRKAPDLKSAWSVWARLTSVGQ